MFMMGAVIPGIHPRTLQSQQLIYVAVQCFHICFSIISPCHTGLIGDHHHQIAGLIQQPDRLHRTWSKLKLIHPVEVFLFNIDGTVTIKKYSWFSIMKPV